MTPLKKKCLRANDGPFMNRELRMATMKRSNLKNKFNRIEQMKTVQLIRGREISMIEFITKIRSLVIVQHEKVAAFPFLAVLKFCSTNRLCKSYYARLHPKTVSDNKKFWKTVKPLFSSTIKSAFCITLSHSSIGKIKGSVSSDTKFSFRKATSDEMLEQLKNLDPKKLHPSNQSLQKY